MQKIYKDLTLEKLENSRVKAVFKLEAENINHLENKILEDKAKNMVIPGFRKGEAPIELVKKQLGEQNIKEEAAKELAAQAMAQIIIENQLKVIGRPDIILGEVKDGQDINLEAYISVLPEVTIDDSYKSALAQINAKELEKSEASEEDVAKVLEQLRREKARILSFEALQTKKVDKMPDIANIPVEQLPQLDEKDFKELAGVDSLEEFKKSVAENIKKEKEFAIKEARRAELAEELLKFVSVNLPDDIVQMEFERSKAMLEQDLQMMGLTLDTYLAQIKKNKEEFEKELYEASRKRSLLQLALDKIAETEHIKVSPEEVEPELEHLAKHNPNIDKNEARAFIDAQKSNEKVFDYLMSLK